jgi:hypothetical protein
MKIRGLAALSSVLICRPGDRPDSASTSPTRWFFNWSAVKAVTETGTSWRFSARFWAVTTISSSDVVSCAKAWPAAAIIAALATPVST